MCYFKDILLVGSYKNFSTLDKFWPDQLIRIVILLESPKVMFMLCYGNFITCAANDKTVVSKANLDLNSTKI
jgi:hypothetical protein